MSKLLLQKANGNVKKKTKRTPKATDIVTTTDSPTLSSPGKLHASCIRHCAFVHIRLIPIFVNFVVELIQKLNVQ